MREHILILLVFLLIAGCATTMLQDTQVEQNRKAFFESVRNGDLNKVNEFLLSGIAPDTTDEGGLTALHEASRLGYTEIVQLLVGKGANVNLRMEQVGFTPLLLAIENIKIVRFLIENGADVNAKDDILGITPLQYAVASGNKEITELLLASGADVNSKEKAFDTTSLHSAVTEGHTEIVELLLANGADTDTKDNMFCRTPLHYAIMEEREEIAKLLIDSGADTTIKDINGHTPFLYAKYCNQNNIVKLLEELPGSSVGKFDAELIEAVGKRTLDEIKKLLAQGADVNARDTMGVSPLHFAAARGDKEIAEHLISKGANVNAVDNIWKNTPLHTAARFGRSNIIEVLVSKGADLNAKYISGHTPLHVAAIEGNSEALKTLIIKGANINSQDKAGKTPLDWAIECKNEDVEKLLRSHGALTGEELKEKAQEK